MKKLKAYWFLEDPLDTEHKYYILMDFLTKTKKSLGKPIFIKRFSLLLNIQKDLINFDKESELSQRTMISMTDNEKDKFYTLLDKNLDDIEEINSIVKNSIDVIQKFMEENESLLSFYNSLVEIKTSCSRYNLWDQGFIIVRKKEKKDMRIFNWFFSIVKISGKESVALLMTELLDPLCPTTNEIKEIRSFLKNNIKDYNERFDCLVIGDINNKVDVELGTDIVKEKSIEIIINNFKGS